MLNQRRTCDHARLDKIENDQIRQKVQVAHIDDEMREVMVGSWPTMNYGRHNGPYM